MVGLFQRISTFVLAVASRRIEEYEACHPLPRDVQERLSKRAEKLGRQEWRAHFEMVYLDDTSGLTLKEKDEEICETPLLGTWDAAGATLDPAPDPKASRADVHMAIAAVTF